MADSDNATRAPESDAQEQSQTEQKTEKPIIPGDTPAQEGPSMGDHEHCVTDRPTRKNTYLTLAKFNTHGLTLLL